MHSKLLISYQSNSRQFLTFLVYARIGLDMYIKMVGISGRSTYKWYLLKFVTRIDYKLCTNFCIETLTDSHIQATHRPQFSQNILYYYIK